MNQEVNNSPLAKCVEEVKSILGEEYEHITIDRVILGLFFTGVKLSTGHGGLCFTPVKDIPEAVCCPSSASAMPNSGKMTGEKASTFIKDLFHKKPLKKAIAIAVLNALSTLCFEKLGGYSDGFKKDVDAFNEVKYSKGDHVVVVGALWPMIRRLIEDDMDFSILELDKRTLREKELKYYVEPDKTQETLAKADVLVITGVTVLNDSLEGLIKAAPKVKEILVTGPTVSMLPSAFFSLGVTVLGGVVVTKPDELLNIISEGGSGYHFFGKSAHRCVLRK